MAKFHGVDYTNNQYITVKTELEEGIYTFQVKVEEQGLVLDVFLHVGDEDEHVITKTAWYEDIGLEKIHSCETKPWIHQYETDDTAKWICPDCGEFTDGCCCDDRTEEELKGLKPT